MTHFQCGSIYTQRLVRVRGTRCHVRCVLPRVWHKLCAQVDFIQTNGMRRGFRNRSSASPSGGRTTWRARWPFGVLDGPSADRIRTEYWSACCAPASGKVKFEREECKAYPMLECTSKGMSTGSICRGKGACNGRINQYPAHMKGQGMIESKT